MKFSLNRRLLLLAVPLIVLTLAACAGQISKPKGWSGGTVQGDTLYIGTQAGDVRALDVKNGFTKWDFELQGEDKSRGVYGAPAVTDDAIYVGGYDSILYALSVSGDSLWQEPVGGSIVGSPVVADGAVLVGATDGVLYAINIEDRAELWRFATGSRVWSSPAVDVGNGVVYLTSFDQKIYALKLADGSMMWEFETDGAVASTPVVNSGGVYVGSFDGVFYALNAATGAPLWQFDGASNWYWGEALVTGDTVYAGSLDGNLYALDKFSGALRWTYATEGPIVGKPVIVFDMIAVPSDDGGLHLVRMADGREVSSCSMGTELRSSLVQQDGVVFLNANDGSIRALRIKSSGNPDEEWVHFANEDKPIDAGRPPDC
ncbi:MAG: PQQ-binding-like beta-propeller repeat protein [Chloroflexi bacterium]|nr:PQQ-binding-like beta-propeller repeat protein [Chloroflexota bacterium]